MTQKKKSDPNVSRPTPGEQERPMNEEELLDTSLDDSMDASDPPAIVHPGGNDPVPSSGFKEEKPPKSGE